MDKRDLEAMGKAVVAAFVLLGCILASFFGVGIITENLWYATLTTLLVFTIGMFFILYYFPKVFEDYIDYYNKKVELNAKKEE